MSVSAIQTAKVIRSAAGMSVPPIPAPAVVFTNGLLDQDFAKTCHGLLRGSARFSPVAVLDSRFAGRDAGEVMDGQKRDVPVVASLDDYLCGGSERPRFFVVGVAFSGGRLPDPCRSEIIGALDLGMTVVCGLHQLLGDDAEFLEAATRGGGEIVDIRRPRDTSELRFWTGEAREIGASVLGVLGTDCAVGKRTTARFLWEAAVRSGIKAEMIYTGQTGWMQGYPHGFLFDATLNDFVSGELERVILECVSDRDPDLIIIEGQGALRNPSGPCGSEIMLSGNARKIVLQHAPGRTHFVDHEEIDLGLPTPQDEMALIRAYGSDVIAVTLNGEGLSGEELREYQLKLAAQVTVPVVRPLEEGVDAVVPAMLEYAR
ncbi:MAG: putative NAD-dependent epimerase/dehydratase family protein [Rhodothermales bacterium]|jgi:uncharacterized NAD-dependent epimerase/dehydratase family protein